MQEGLPPYGEEYARRCEKERDWYRNMIAEIRIRHEEELYYDEEDRRRKARGAYC
ncbi:MAG: hypothetical protein NC489_33560 [Ruminococcus flavefaciens]|nr:hypothetical protein [Ruminococcus flavefaciens]